MERLLTKLGKSGRPVTATCCVCPNVLDWPKKEEISDELEKQPKICLHFDGEEKPEKFYVTRQTNYQLDAEKMTLDIFLPNVGITICLTSRTEHGHTGVAFIWKRRGKMPAQK